MIDILNRNKRRSALWRIGGVLGAILAIFLTVSASMHSAYSNQGSGELKLLKDSLINQQMRTSAVINGLVQDTVRLNREIEMIKTNDAAQSTIKDLEEELENLKKKLERKEERLEECFEEKSYLETSLKNKPC